MPRQVLAVSFWKAAAEVKGNNMCYNTKELYAHMNGETSSSMRILSGVKRQMT